MTLERTVQTAIDDGMAAAGDALDARRELRRRETPGSKARETKIAEQLELIQAAMGPIRSLIGQALWRRVPREEELRSVSQRLQYERRQLKKMRR